MNKVILTGNLCREIELKQTESGNDVVINCVAVRRDYKNAQGLYDSDFIDIVAWNNQATYLNNYAAKGDRVELVGRWQTRNYINAQNVTIKVNEVVVESISVFKPKVVTEQTKPNNGEFEVSEYDLPF
jgi:single-strand DNA-binding protein